MGKVPSFKRRRAHFSTTNLELQMFLRDSHVSSASDQKLNLGETNYWVSASSKGEKSIISYCWCFFEIRRCAPPGMCLKKPMVKPLGYLPPYRLNSCGCFLNTPFFWGGRFSCFFRIGGGGCGERERGVRGYLKPLHSRERFGTTPRFRYKHILVEGFCLATQKNTTKNHWRVQVGFQKYVL